MADEIERKFLVRKLPFGWQSFPSDLIQQGYIVHGVPGIEVRVRQKGEHFFETVKKGSGEVRPEYEIELSRGQFDVLWPLTADCRLVKRRYRIPWRNRLVELDVYQDGLAGLVTADVEFPSRLACIRFTPSYWLGEDVSRDLRFTNQNLAKYGMPTGTRLHRVA